MTSPSELGLMMHTREGCRSASRLGECVIKRELPFPSRIDDRLVSGRMTTAMSSFRLVRSWCRPDLAARRDITVDSNSE